MIDPDAAQDELATLGDEDIYETVVIENGQPTVTDDGETAQILEQPTQALVDEPASGPTNEELDAIRDSFRNTPEYPTNTGRMLATETDVEVAEILQELEESIDQ